MRVLNFAWDVLKSVFLGLVILLMFVLALITASIILFWTPIAAFCLLWAGTVFAPAVFVMGWKTYFATLAVYYFAVKPFSVNWTEKRKKAITKMMDGIKEKI